MHISYHKKDSRNLGRPMEHKRYGHAGRPVVVFPTSNGRFFQYEDSGAVAALSEFIDDGRIQVLTLDGIDGETFLSKDPDLQARIGRHDAYFRYVSEEAFPDLVARSAGFERRPGSEAARDRLFDGRVPRLEFPVPFSRSRRRRDRAQRRLFDAGFFRRGARRRNFLQLAARLSGRPERRAACWPKLRASRMIFCCGQGAWEERMLIETRQLEQVLRDKEIPAWVDYWGTDVNHDWPWWHKQLKYFMQHWLDDDYSR